jgi:TonB-dependent receptor
MLKLVQTFLFFFISTVLLSQSGRITGKVIDAKTGETLPGATVLIDGTNKVASTDFDGNFSINNITPGKVTIVASYISYDSKKLLDVSVVANDVTNINIQLNPSSSTELQEVVVAVEINKENTAALVLMQKNNVSVSDGVSAETIKRTPDRNTADVLKRVSGVTIIDDKFVIIRGLNDRYNVSYLNGSPLPNTEADRKSFAFDIFPSNMLDNILVNKTATPDMPGDFAGGIVQINTKNIPDKNFISVSLSGGYNSITTGKEKIYYNGGKTDWLGLDDGTRALPAEIPESKIFPQSDAERGKLAKSFQNDWTLQRGKFDPNYSAQIATGQNIKLKERDFFGIIFSLTYNNSNSFYNRQRQAFSNSAGGNADLQLDDRYAFEIFANQTLAAAVLNTSFKLNENNTISIKNVYSISSDDRVIHSKGSSSINDPNAPVNDLYTRFFKSNTVYSGQLLAENYMPKLKIKTSLIGSYGNSKRDIPNYRTSSYTKRFTIDDPENPYSVAYDTMTTANVQVATTGPDYMGYRFFSKLNENIKSLKGDASRSFKISEKFKTDIKLGGLVQFRDRTFSARQLGYTRYQNKFKNSLLYASMEDIFAPENMGNTVKHEGYADSTGFKLLDITKPTDKYNATSQLYAGYVMLDSKFSEWFRAVYGLRVEDFRQTVHTNRTKVDTLIFSKHNLNFLPSVNLIFSLNEKQNIRVSYSRTLNRPEFRELAPFNFFDPETRFTTSGDTTLSQCTIDNYDLRYEMYPGRGQIFSVSGFYKEFLNPIEMVAQEAASDELSFRNSPSALVYGAELEFRVIVGAILKADSSRFLNNLSLFSNLSYFKSEVTLFKPGSTTEKYTRYLQGQSPYIINSGILYNDPKLGFSIGFMLNRIGPRIYNVGTKNDPDRWENGRTVLDFQASKQLLNNRLELRLNIKDILHQNEVIYQNSDSKVKYSSGVDFDNFVRSYGTVYSFQLNFRF